MLGCITTSGGEDNCHPSGIRTFTIDELKALNGMPLDFQFPEVRGPGNWDGMSRGEILKQIGNCIPPLVWTAFVRSIIDTLRAHDNGDLDADSNRIARRYNRADSTVSDYIMVDSDSDDEFRPVARKLPLAMRHMSVVESRASSRTLSPERSTSASPAKRLKATPPSKKSQVIDLTAEE